VIKRTLDIVLGTVLAVLMTPLIIVLAIGAALSLRTWPFFAHRRIGRGGREFVMVKIRTMPPSTPIYADRDAVANVPIPPFCALLRRLHIDELPQLYHVPFGQMSLVGPRPEVRAFHEQMDPEFAALRTSVRPGCSGLWQVTDGIKHLHYDVPIYDRFYVANANIKLDLWILLHTLTLVSPGRRTRTLAEVPRWTLPKDVHHLGEIIDMRTATTAHELARTNLAADA